MNMIMTKNVKESATERKEKRKTKSEMQRQEWVEQE